MRERLVRSGQVNYQIERSNDAWPDHRLRTLVTAAAIAWLQPRTILDPACGDGSIVYEASRLWTAEDLGLSDISQPNIDHLTTLGPPSPGQSMWAARLDVNKAIARTNPTWDVIVLTEILEHLDDPDTTLALARKAGKRLVASSPEMRPGQVDPNPEHLWMFDRAGYQGMLVRAGWKAEQYTKLVFPSLYDFGIWVCS